jgi:hypothetical protein
MVGFLLKIFGGGPDSGLFGYLRSRDSNKTQRMIAQSRNETEIQIEKDRNRTRIQLERERRTTALELIDQLSPGSEYRESTMIDERVIRKAQAPPVTVLVPNANREARQTTSAQAERIGPQTRAIDKQNASQPPQSYVPDDIDQTQESEHQLR